jgi:hypothetical protein
MVSPAIKWFRAPTGGRVRSNSLCTLAHTGKLALWVSCEYAADNVGRGVPERHIFGLGLGR